MEVRSQLTLVMTMITLTVIVAYMIACIIALAFGARWIVKHDPLLRKHVLELDAGNVPQEKQPAR